MQEHNQPIELLRLGMSQELKENYNANKVTFNKSFGRALSEARSKAKKEKCFVCQKEVSSFCNSHSIPQFCLSIVAIGIPKDRKVSRLYFTPTFSFSGSHAAVIR